MEMADVRSEGTVAILSVQIKNQNAFLCQNYCEARCGLAGSQNELLIYRTH